MKLARRKVYRHAQRGQARVLPGLVLSASGAQYPFAYRYNQPGIFRQGDKIPRQDQSPPGNLPAYQSFHADYLSRIHIYLGLVINHKLIAIQRAAQAVFHSQPFKGFGVHGRSIQLVVILAVFFGPVHRGVGIFQQALGIFTVVWIEGYTNTRGDIKLVNADMHRFSDGPENFPGDLNRVFRLKYFRQQHGKLVASQSCHSIVFTHISDQPPGDNFQHLVPHIVPQRIVYQFKPVQVEKQHRQHLLIALCAGYFQSKTVLEKHPVGQTG
ncbi:MAG: hypothetical protein A4E54_00063 [Pelotomaculum sp. PtaB.Bin117]|nr:MAG: hypothetical protein A4E54_00063 [Pelotomaculum sp. PtaB.Bin117]